MADQMSACGSRPTSPTGQRIAVAFFARGGENRPAVIATAARMIYDAFGSEPRVNGVLRLLAGHAASADLGNAAERPGAASN